MNFKTDNEIEIPEGVAVFDQETKNKMVEELEKKDISNDEIKQFSITI